MTDERAATNGRSWTGDAVDNTQEDGRWDRHQVADGLVNG